MECFRFCLMIQNKKKVAKHIRWRRAFNVWCSSYHMFYSNITRFLKRGWSGVKCVTIYHCSWTITLDQWQGFDSFRLLKFHDFPWTFPLLFKVFHDLTFTIFIDIFNWLCFILHEKLPLLFILYNQCHFPWLSMTHTWIPWLSRPGKSNHKIPWLSRFSMTCMNPELTLLSKWRGP